jgi:hypothetical protein
VPLRVRGSVFVEVVGDLELGQAVQEDPDDGGHLAGVPAQFGMATGRLVEPPEVASLIVYLASPVRTASPAPTTSSAPAPSASGS